MTQPAPTPNDNPPIFELVMADIRTRAEQGRQSYGTYLQADNGRDALTDAYEEALDLCCYLRQAIAERQPLAPQDDGVQWPNGRVYEFEGDWMIAIPGQLPVRLNTKETGDWVLELATKQAPKPVTLRLFNCDRCDASMETNGSSAFCVNCGIAAYCLSERK